MQAKYFFIFSVTFYSNFPILVSYSFVFFSPCYLSVGKRYYFMVIGVGPQHSTFFLLYFPQPPSYKYDSCNNAPDAEKRYGKCG